MTGADNEINNDFRAGVWQGIFSYGASSQLCKFVLRLDVDAKGAIKGSIYEENHKAPVPITGILVSPMIKFEKTVTSKWGQMYEPLIYEGTVNAEQTRLSGTWTNATSNGVWSAQRTQETAPKEPAPPVADVEQDEEDHVEEHALPVTAKPVPIIQRPRSTYQKLAAIAPPEVFDAQSKPRSTFTRLQAMAKTPEGETEKPVVTVPPPPSADAPGNIVIPPQTTYVSSASPATLDTEVPKDQANAVCPRCGAARGAFSFCTNCGHTFDLNT
jgi:hypothetical protein